MHETGSDERAGNRPSRRRRVAAKRRRRGEDTRHGVDRRSHRARGQSLAEFALALPVFIFLTIGVLDVARVFTSHIALVNAVREAALYGAIGPADTARITDRLKSDTDAGGLTWAQVTPITIQCTSAATPTGWGACPGGSTTFVQVAATYQMDLLTPVISNAPFVMGANTVVPFIPTPSASVAPSASAAPSASP